MIKSCMNFEKIEVHEKSHKFVFLKGQKSAFFWSQRQFWGNFG